MRIALVTDAWQPQVNGVVTTLVELVRELGEMGHDVRVVQPGQFRTRPCPGYAGIDLAIAPGLERLDRRSEHDPGETVDDVSFGRQSRGRRRIEVEALTVQAVHGQTDGLRQHGRRVLEQ